MAECWTDILTIRVPAVLSELRLLASARLDRMRVRLALDRASPDELRDCLEQLLHKAGAVKLMTPELIATLCDHALCRARHRA